MAPHPDEQQPQRDVRPTGASRPLEQPASQTPPRQEGQPAPTLQRWVFGVGGAVILFAVIWALVSWL